MNGLTMNYSKTECANKDKLVQDFIKQVNPYRAKPSLGIDLRSLSKYAKENNKAVLEMTASELENFAL